MTRRGEIRGTALGLVLACHPGPCAVVTAVALVLGIALGYPPARLAILGLVILTGQLSIGFSNDWIDAARDRAVGRLDKPTVTGLVRVAVVRRAALIAAAASILFSLVLGPGAALANLVSFGGGWAYNARLKATPVSIVPYLVSFGALPAIVTLGLTFPRAPQLWAVIAGALLGAAAHFTNVLPDLSDDRATAVRGLPHVLGRRTSGCIAFLTVAAVGLLCAFGVAWPPSAPLLIGAGLGLVIAATGIALTLTRPPARILMRLVMAAALIDVAMFAVAGASIVA